jgi:hypothetical protein
MIPTSFAFRPIRQDSNASDWPAETLRRGRQTVFVPGRDGRHRDGKIAGNRIAPNTDLFDAFMAVSRDGNLPGHRHFAQRP